MKKTIIATALIIFSTSIKIFAVEYYVSKTGAHIPPFASLPNAATNIQAAVDTASSGDIVLVNDGTYYPSSEISITNDITVKSINGADKTVIDGKGTNRCFYTEYVNYTIDGFTVSNGFSSSDGGGICAESGIIQNCIIVNNISLHYGGGIYCYRNTLRNCIVKENKSPSGDGGGVYCDYGTVTNCTIIKNYAGEGGGGIYCYEGLVINCTVNDNFSYEYDGGGINANRAIVKECTVTGNITKYDGGGIGFSRSTIENCFVSNNSATNSDSNGGGIFGFRGYIRNCLVINNFAKYNGGGLCIEQCNAENCTVVSNSANHYGGGTYCRGGMIQDSIIWNNTNDAYFYYGSTNRYNCIENLTNLVNGIITNNPEFAYADTGNYQLVFFSPCINAGTNMDWMASATDLNGNPRIISNNVDMGCYEFLPEPGSIYYLLFIICNLFMIRRIGI